jgi:hypothetical protein
MSGPLPDVDHLHLLLDQVDQRTRYQRDEWDGLDRKATTTLATAGVVLGLVVNNAPSFVGTPSPGPFAFVLALGALVLALAAGVAALWPRDFRVVPDPVSFLDAYAGQPTDVTVGTLVSTKAKYFEENRGPLRTKLRLLRAQMALVSVAGGLLAYVLVLAEIQ